MPVTLKGENLLQMQVCRILSFCGLPYFSIPNGANKGYHAKIIFSATGLKAGVPDLFVCRAFGIYHGLFLELKDGKKARVSPLQLKWHETLSNEGYKVVIIRTLSELYKTIIECYEVESRRIHNINKLVVIQPDVDHAKPNKIF